MMKNWRMQICIFMVAPCALSASFRVYQLELPRSKFAAHFTRNSFDMVGEGFILDDVPEVAPQYVCLKNLLQSAVAPCSAFEIRRIDFDDDQRRWFQKYLRTKDWVKCGDSSSIAEIVYAFVSYALHTPERSWYAFVLSENTDPERLPSAAKHRLDVEVIAHSFDLQTHAGINSRSRSRFLFSPQSHAFVYNAIEKLVDEQLVPLMTRRVMELIHAYLTPQLLTVEYDLVTVAPDLKEKNALQVSMLDFEDVEVHRNSWMQEARRIAFAPLALRKEVLDGIVCSPTGRQLALLYDRFTSPNKLWFVALSENLSQEVISAHLFKTSIDSLCYSEPIDFEGAIGAYCAVAARDGYIHFFQCSGKSVISFDPIKYNSRHEYARAMRFSSSGQDLVVGTTEGSVYVIETPHRAYQLKRLQKLTKELMDLLNGFVRPGA